MTTSATDSKKIQLSGSSAIHVGPIVTNGSNETISIVIPFSAQVATIGNHQMCLDEMRAGSSCSDCGKDLAAPVALTQHVRHQAASNSKGCPFPTCNRYGRAFSRAHDLKRHIARHEARKERLSETVDDGLRRCTTCDMHFLNEALLKEHEDVHKITDCSKGESKVSGCHYDKNRYDGHDMKLKAHLLTRDKKSVSDECALCGSRFDDDGLHTKKQTGITLESQDIGSRMQDTEVYRNAKINDSNKIRCDYCWKTFKSKWTLNSHVAAHEGRFQFDCNKCGKKFVRKSHFEGHMRSHEAARPYACDICGSTFKQVKHRKEHVKRKHPAGNNQNAVQSLFDSINAACVSEKSTTEQTNFTIFVPNEFNQIN